jgi:hypothetical protein
MIKTTPYGFDGLNLLRLQQERSSDTAGDALVLRVARLRTSDAADDLLGPLRDRICPTDRAGRNTPDLALGWLWPPDADRHTRVRGHGRLGTSDPDRDAVFVLHLDLLARSSLVAQPKLAVAASLSDVATRRQRI